VYGYLLCNQEIKKTDRIENHPQKQKAYSVSQFPGQHSNQVSKAISSPSYISSEFSVIYLYLFVYIYICIYHYVYVLLPYTMINVFSLLMFLLNLIFLVAALM